jgi:pyruvate/2-oxoglutarate dehydrogenase complex dihydrolipoamide dehydrogenase (E3) component
VTGEIDVDAVLARREQIVHNMDDSGAVPWLEDRGVALIRGYARLEGERRVRVGELLCAAREAVVIAVGSGAAMRAISGLAEARPGTNREVTTARRIPRSLVWSCSVAGRLGSRWRRRPVRSVRRSRCSRLRSAS